MPLSDTHTPGGAERRPLKTLSAIAGSQLAFIIENSPWGVLLFERSGKIIYGNPAFTQITGYTAGDWENKTCGQLLANHPPNLFDVLQDACHNGRLAGGEYQFIKKGAEDYWIRLTVTWQPLGAEEFGIAYLEDISLHKQREQDTEHLTFYDSLTDLPNRLLFNGRLNLALEHARKSGQKVAVVLLDLDRFQVINDTLGHGAGDLLLQNVGNRLRLLMSESDLLARMGGDEFIILLSHLNSFQEAFKKIQSLMEIFREPFACEGRELHVNTSMGVALFPEDGEDPLMLLKNADSALFQAKDSGRNHYKFYTARFNASSHEQLELETAMRRGLEQDQFRLFYQPQVDLRTGQVVAVESLLRWQHPELGLVAPDRFIGLAEETGLIVNLGRWALREACRQTMVWHKAGFPGLRVAVNVSPRQFQEPELVEYVLGVCKETGLPPEYLEIEITESILMNDVNAAMVLRWLRKKGVTIALDDFGTGYSSLTYLKKFPVNVVKIDRSFIGTCLTNPDDAAIVTTILSIAHNMKLAVIAEGVEEEGQLQFLRNLQCEYMQGYFFSKPLPEPDLTRLLTEGRRLPPAPGF